MNKHIWKQSVKFEDLKIALNFVFEDCWMIKFDIHSAYHHISVRESQTGMLGFSWQINGQTIYFKFLVLPFGMSCAPYIYTKLTRPLIKKWRSECKRVLMYLDDGFGCGATKQKNLDMALDIKQDLILSGFVPKVEKCLWVPVQSLRFLGDNIDAREGYLTIPENRIEKTLNTLAEIKRDVESREKVFVRKIASFVGQIISMAIVIGNVSLIMTKSLSYDIKEANTWFSCIILSEESKVQLEFWQENIKHLNCKRMFSVHSFSKIIFSDASSTGFAGYQVAMLNGVSHGMWAPDEVLKSSTWRELSAVHRVLHSFAKSLRNSKVKWYSDNAAVCSIVSKGYMKRELQRLALDIFSLCIQYSIHL